VQDSYVSSSYETKVIVLLFVNLFVISLLEDDTIKNVGMLVSESSVADGGGSYQHLEGSLWHI
jgi:hypothetical protein